MQKETSSLLSVVQMATRSNLLGFSVPVSPVFLLGEGEDVSEATWRLLTRSWALLEVLGHGELCALGDSGVQNHPELSAVMGWRLAGVFSAYSKESN